MHLIQQKEQLVILVTSVMTWIRTPKKLKKNRPKRQEIDDSDAEAEANRQKEDESETEDEPGKPDNKVLYFLDKDF